MSSSTCSTSSVLPSWVSFAFGGAMILILILTAIYSLKLLKNEPGWNDKTCISKIQAIAKNIWQRKRCYLPIVTHFADITTDFAVVVEFYLISQQVTPKDCDGLNIFYLFLLSLSCMVFYRLISSWTIYQITKSFCRTICQLLDVEIFRILFISHKFGYLNASSPQRLVLMIEAIFEAAPQSVIQILYILKSGNTSSVVIISSFVLSLINITKSVIDDDKTIMKNRDTDNKRWLTTTSVYLFRFCDIPSQIFLLSLIWTFINGYVLFGILILDGFIVLCVYALNSVNRNIDALLGLVALPFSYGSGGGHPYCCGICFSSSQSQRLLYLYWFYRFSWCITVNLLIYFNISENGLNEYVIFIRIIYCFSAIASLFKWILLLIIYKLEDGRFTTQCKERSDFQKMVEGGLFDDILEIIFYKMSPETASKKIFSNDRLSLLNILLRANKEKLFSNIVNKYGIDMFAIDDPKYQSYQTALKRAVGYVDNDSYIKILLSHSECTLQYLKYQNPFHSAAYNGFNSYLDLLWTKINDLGINDEQKIEFLNLPNHRGYNALMLAISNSYDSVDTISTAKKIYSMYPTITSKRNVLEIKQMDSKSLLDLTEKYRTEMYQLVMSWYSELNLIHLTKNDAVKNKMIQDNFSNTKDLELQIEMHQTKRNNTNFDEFNPDLCGRNIEILNNNKMVKKTGTTHLSGSNCFGKAVIPSTKNGKYVWQIRISEMHPINGVSIGIDNTIFDNNVQGQPFHDKHLKASYAYNCVKGVVISWNGYGGGIDGFPKTQIQTGYKPDIVTMTLNISEHHSVLSYRINDDKEFIACDNVSREKSLDYRLAIDMGAKKFQIKNVIELIDC